MKMQQIRSLAKVKGINSFGKTKSNLIREIQCSEGNFDCFGSAKQFCDQWNCRFRSLCLSDINTKPRPKRHIHAAPQAD